ncbi:MAG: HNH endonuclease [Catenulispora sp.]|nr:HNH endonuclease [Catenulispora sp.]
MTIRRGDPCTIPDCGKPVMGRGWCSRHYGIWRKFGDPLHPVRKYERRDGECSESGCTNKLNRNGMCHKHATRMERYGTTMEPYERRFWASVDRRGEDQCWPWMGVLQSNGYGMYGSIGSRLAHRIAYRLTAGPIPEGLVLDHLCHTRDRSCADNANCPHRRCVNPTHLEPVTRRENIARGRGGDSWGYARPQSKPRAEKPTVCTNGCNRPLYKRDLCRPCYRKWLKDPAVERPSQRTPEQRFWAKVRKTDTCWLWTASINRHTGYARFGVRHGEMVDGHRYSYLLHHGAIPEKHDVHHTCHVRHCVNPAHLEAVTRAENLRQRKVRRS